MSTDIQYTNTHPKDTFCLHFPDLIFCFNENRGDTTGRSGHINSLSALSYDPLLFFPHCLSRSVRLMIHDCWSMAALVSFRTTAKSWLFCWHLTAADPWEEESGRRRARNTLTASHTESQQQSWQRAPNKSKYLFSRFSGNTNSCILPPLCRELKQALKSKNKGWPETRAALSRVFVQFAVYLDENEAF